MGCGNVPGVIQFQISKSRDSSTFVKAEMSAGFEIEQEVPVRVDSIDNILRERGYRIPDVIKIDAEGFDLKVLQGARSCHGKTRLIFIECHAEGSGYENTLSRVIREMDALDYVPMEISGLSRGGGHQRFLFCEMAFVLRTAPF